GTTRDIFTFEDMKEISIPLPDNIIQQSVVNIFSCYQSRYNINEKLKSQIKDICPIIIKGSIEEAQKRGGIING
ncbi:MAG TPA: type I restriction endonuclease subunit S, partial [Lactococcus sp.]|nr:type I restriction endonuclease subunit S [Lactococcus sp.]